jgi:hypothetical protein
LREICLSGKLFSLYLEIKLIYKYLAIFSHEL